MAGPTQEQERILKRKIEQDGYSKITFYDYSADFSGVMVAALAWIKEHPEYFVEDIILASDEVIWCSLFCKRR